MPEAPHPPFIETYTQTSIAAEAVETSTRAPRTLAAIRSVQLIRIFSEINPLAPSSVIAETQRPDDTYVLCAPGFQEVALSRRPQFQAAIERTAHIAPVEKSISVKGKLSSNGYRRIEARIRVPGKPEIPPLRPDEAVLQRAAEIFGQPSTRPKGAELCSRIEGRNLHPDGWVLSANVSPKKHQIIGRPLRRNPHNPQTMAEMIATYRGALDCEARIVSASLWVGLMVLAGEQALHDAVTSPS